MFSDRALPPFLFLGGGGGGGIVPRLLHFLRRGCGFGAGRRLPGERSALPFPLRQPSRQGGQGRCGGAGRRASLRLAVRTIGLAVRTIGLAVQTIGFPVQTIGLAVASVALQGAVAVLPVRSVVLSAVPQQGRECAGCAAAVLSPDTLPARKNPLAERGNDAFGKGKASAGTAGCGRDRARSGAAAVPGGGERRGRFRAGKPPPLPALFDDHDERLP